LDAKIFILAEGTALLLEKLNERHTGRVGFFAKVWSKPQLGK